MRQLVKVVLSALLALAFLGAAGVVIMAPETRQALHQGPNARAAAEGGAAPPAADAPSVTGSPFGLFGRGGFESGGYGTAVHYTVPIRDAASIEELRAARAARVQRGLAEQTAALETARGAGARPGSEFRALQAEASIAFLLMYEGRFREAASGIERAIKAAPNAPPDLITNLEALLGVIELRRGELENCLECRGPSSCILPIDRAAVHQRPSGSRAAIEHFTAYLQKRPEDLGVRWLLNIAAMTLGRYPDRPPARWRFPASTFESKTSVGRFRNIASEVGLNARGPNMAGGSVFDDFNGDGRPDVFISELGPDLGASFFINRGDGLFEDHSESAGLAAQPLALNTVQADYDNDGWLDVLLLRGGWENAARLTLLRNKGDGSFDDVTIASGLGAPIASQSAAWGDFDNDGHVDLYVCGERASGKAGGLFAGDGDLVLEDPRDHGRLYRNNGDGTFTDVAEAAGVRNDHYAKGAVWGDYDNDGDVDLYVSNFDADNRLYRNNGDGTFTDVARALGVAGPFVSFPCGFLDYDNDGRLDLFVVDYAANLNEYVKNLLAPAEAPTCHPRLYHNLGPGKGFRDVSLELGLRDIVLAMGLAIGDIDNDGFQDIYLGTGRPDYSALMPNVLFHNNQGRSFEDVSFSSGTAHLQKGHGCSLADWDDDGDLDLFVEVGGAVPGDRANNLLFDNPGHGRHWLKVRLVGTRSNRSALGARLRVDVKGPDGRRSIFRQIGGTTSFGGPTLTELIGLGDATIVEAVTATWPASGTSQTFRDVPADHTVEIVEGAKDYRAIEPAPIQHAPSANNAQANGPNR